MGLSVLLVLPRDEYEQAMPIQDRIDKINKLYDEGHTIVYLTARGMGRYNNIVDLAVKEFYEFTEIQLSLWDVSIISCFLVNHPQIITLTIKGTLR